MKLEFLGYGLYSGFPWVEHRFGDCDAILDGKFTSDQLREIADAMDDNAMKAHWPEHVKAAWEAEAKARAKADAELAARLSGNECVATACVDAQVDGE